VAQKETVLLVVVVAHLQQDLLVLRHQEETVVLALHLLFLGLLPLTQEEVGVDR
jgi:hypothetical protein